MKNRRRRMKSRTVGTEVKTTPDIVEAYAGATTWMGFKESADLEKWERLTRESDNQMILEMDTGPSVAGTEYSFFGRRNQDHDGEADEDAPRPLIANNRWRREEYVRNHLRARPVVLSGDGETRKDQYTTLPEMPFHIERLFFTKRHENDTEGRFMHIATLAEGEEVTIRSVEHPERATKIERLQAAIIPAGMGRHEYINERGG